MAAMLAVVVRGCEPTALATSDNIADVWCGVTVPRNLPFDFSRTMSKSVGKTVFPPTHTIRPDHRGKLKARSDIW